MEDGRTREERNGGVNQVVIDGWPHGVYKWPYSGGLEANRQGSQRL